LGRRNHQSNVIMRRLSNLAALFSLLLFAAVVALWLRGHAWGHQLQWRKAEDFGTSRYTWWLVVEWGSGGLQVAQDAEVYERSAAATAQASRVTGRWAWHGHSISPARYPRPAFSTLDRPRLGFWLRWQNEPWVVRRELIVPFWLLAVLTLPLPALWSLRFRRRRVRARRAALGLCLDCGYDLRATPGTCPECGAVKSHGGAEARPSQHAALCGHVDQ
jgi:hypothetical protein